ncbi:putative N-acetylgalactosaminyl-diphosphoundecaprenol glucuronosyltransferase [Vibrio astriarenae]|nr:putative N-acetylgalactosaminyl-diphosphoundecaprenol glucuronosyltransferase [Vibrio sp. C7]
MSSVLVSIITPSYNSKRYIKETIDSVLNQSFESYEMIIVDDCSTDGSYEYIKSIVPDERFKVLKLDENSGPAVARNLALKNAQGKYLAFLDSDDLWAKNKLEEQISFMARNNYAFTFTNYELINECGASLGKVIKSPSSVDFDEYMKNTIIGCLTVVIDRDKVKSFSMPNLRTSQDMVTWGDIMRTNNIRAYCLKLNLARYRIVGNSNTSNKIKSACHVMNVYNKYYRFGLFKSTWLFLHYAFNALRKRV